MFGKAMDIMVNPEKYGIKHCPDCVGKTSRPDPECRTCKGSGLIPDPEKKQAAEV